MKPPMWARQWAYNLTKRQDPTTRRPKAVPVSTPRGDIVKRLYMEKRRAHLLGNLPPLLLLAFAVGCAKPPPCDVCGPPPECLVCGETPTGEARRKACEADGGTWFPGGGGEGYCVTDVPLPDVQGSPPKDDGRSDLSEMQ